jgi:aspartate/methionine/tyrosine aminotransferase
MTGWRLGAAIGPAEYLEVIAKLNINDESCSNHFVQYGALEGPTGDQSGPRRIVETLRERSNIAVRRLNQVSGVPTFTREATFYLIPNVTGLMKRNGFTGYDELPRSALNRAGVSFCTRLHFGRSRPGETKSYARCAYSGIGLMETEEGLNALEVWGWS